MQASEDVGETSKGYADQIDMDLEITIMMIKDKKNVVFVAPLSEQDNANEDVKPHAHVDEGDIAIELHLL